MLKSEASTALLNATQKAQPAHIIYTQRRHYALVPIALVRHLGISERSRMKVQVIDVDGRIGLFYTLEDGADLH